MFFKRVRKDRKGLTLVELICAVAILGVISATVGGAMVVATHTYRSGTIETAMQSEAQFTINSIESLIIDATNTVEYSGNVLTITNVDYTYVITYDTVAKELRYSQSDSVTGAVIVSNELLAQHVAHFDAFTDDFPVTRNVRLELTLENEGKSFTTAYNITSRNNPNAGAPPVVATVINVNHDIVLEPNDVYVLPVSVLGAPGLGYTFSLVPESDHISYSTASSAAGGIELKIHETETGGGDEKLYLNITASDGTPTQVTIRIRRVYDNDLGVDFPYGLSPNGVGTNLMQGAEYTVTAQVVGSNLDPEPIGTDYDRDYSPYTKKVIWSFEIVGGDGGDGDSYAEIVSDVDNGNDTQTLTFRLKKNLDAGATLRIWATALHPEGVYSVGGASTNKNGLPYGVGAKDKVELAAPNGGIYPSDLRRGIEGYATVDLDPAKLVENEWTRNHPGESSPYRGGFSGNVYFRYTSTDGVDQSAGYPGWKQMGDQGMQMTQLKFNAGDFINMYLMKDYTLEILYSFRYDNGAGGHYYPETAYTDNSGVPNPYFGLRGNPDDDQYIYRFPLQCFGVYFDAYRDEATGGSWDTFNAIADQYKIDGGLGLGTASNPIKFKYGNNVQIRTNYISGAAANRGPTEYLYQNSAKLYKQVNGNWVQVNNFNCREYNKSGLDTSTLYFEPQNGQLSKNVTYRLELTQVKNNDRGGILEDYASESILGYGGRGVIYFQLY